MKLWRPAVLATVVALTAGLATGPASAQEAASQVVSYHGYRVTVPSDWEVVDLRTHPAACVRFDRPAVYLGRSDSQPNCPAHVIGRTAGLVVEPLTPATAKAHAVATLPGTATPPAGTRSADGEIQVAVEDAGVLVTASHGPNQEREVREILGEARLTSGAEPAKLTRRTAGTTRTTAASIVATGNLQAQAFDTCTAPSQSAMNAWRAPASPYKAVGIYISGDLQACDQPNLTPEWVAVNAAAGWQFLLIDVGLQAPCSNLSSRMSTDPATARAQGRTAAAESVIKAGELGFGQRSAIYTDIEGYASTAACKASVLSYVSGWTLELNQRGYVGGIYTSAASGGVDLASGYNDPAYTRPDNLWFARWNGQISTADDKYIPATYWTNHQRVHQFFGNRSTTYGGVTMNIDGNSANLSAPPPPVTGLDATGQYAKAALRWTAPAGTSLGQIIVRRATGATPPATPTTGTAVYAGTAGTTTATGLANATSYAFRAWVKDSTGKIGPSADTRLTGTRTSATHSAAAVAYGAAVTLYGKVARVDTGAAVAGTPLSLYARTKNSTAWREVGRVNSNSTGNVSYVHKPTVSTVYQWGHNGTADLLGSRSANATVEVRPTITANLSPTAVKLGGATNFYGYLRPTHPGQTVYLQRLSGSGWLTVTTTKLNSTGNYGFTVKPGVRGTTTYRVVWLADGDHATTVSATRTVTVS